jgi:hypothetical protein
MERLRDQNDSNDPVVARAANLLSSFPPIDADTLGPRPRLPPQEAARHGAAGFRLALVGALTMATVVAAAASAQRAGFFGTPREGAETIVDPPAPAAPLVAPRLAPVAPPVASPPHESARVETASPSMPTPRRISAEPSSVGSGAGESILMVQAVRALRRDNDPTRAQQLAEEALHRYPRGSQAEEAMVLSMEAAAARGDGPGARRAAERYLGRFPSGRFADRARHVLGGS